MTPTQGAAASIARGLARRDVCKLGLLAFTGSVIPLGKALGAWRASLTPGDFPIPADKKLDPEWVASLTARGAPTVYRSRSGELDFIGMPIGGICCGQVYLGGDGSLWHWDIFNLPQAVEWTECSGILYSKPSRRESPIRQGFAIRVTSDGVHADRRLDVSGFGDIEFRGQYPIGLVRYSDTACPVHVELEAFSPFCPLDEATSGMPAIVMRYTVTNTSSSPADVSLAGWLENPVCARTGREEPGVRTSRIVRDAAGLTLEYSATPPTYDPTTAASSRPDVTFEDWERGTYDGWTATGTAFGDRPRAKDDIAAYQGDLAMQGTHTVNTHETRHDDNVVKADTHIGSLTSRAFTIERHYISFRIGGGNHPGQTCVNLLVDGAVVRTATGRDNNRMRPENFDVREFAGRQAQIQIMDGCTGAWGQIGCDDIVFCDAPRREPYEMDRAVDFGSMSLSILGATDGTDGTAAGVDDWQASLGDHAGAAQKHDQALTETPATGCVRVRPFTLAPGESRTITFLIAWWFPNPDRNQLGFLTGASSLRRWYATRFNGAGDVRTLVMANLDALAGITRRWRDTWYDSTLPHWFLDRTFANLSTAATATCWRFDNGRFYGWEGTYSCAGTCTHVWQYAQALGRVFPALERSSREQVDFGLAFHLDTGAIDYRAEAAREVAVDGQCGTILRAYREHTMSADERFLKAVWPRVKKAIEHMIARDTDQDGILDGPQYNTLDTTWYGAISWLSSLYLAALRAGEAMARDIGEGAFAARCAAIAERGRASMVEQLFNGEFFIHKADPGHPEANSTGNGCHIDQLLGQSWAHQLALPRIVPITECLSALRSLYKYSFTTDIGPYRRYAERVINGGRWYALAGEGGLLMCTWPHGGSESATGKGGDAWAAGYFNECMTGFEHQVASHMIAEGLVIEGLAITRMIHDRYHAARRNPWNEIECGNHYARAMASYGSFVTMCGFEHHGPRGRIAFAPRLTPEDFRAPFIGAAGWGQFRQQRTAGSLSAELEVRWGEVRVTELGLELPEGWKPKACAVSLGGNVLSRLSQEGRRARVTLQSPVVVKAGSTLSVTLEA